MLDKWYPVVLSSPGKTSPSLDFAETHQPWKCWPWILKGQIFGHSMSRMWKSPGPTTGGASVPTEEIRMLCLVGRWPGSHHMQSHLIYPAFRFRVHIILKNPSNLNTMEVSFFLWYKRSLGYGLSLVLVLLVCILHEPMLLLSCCSTVLSTLSHGPCSCSHSCQCICIPDSGKWALAIISVFVSRM